MLRILSNFDNLILNTDTYNHSHWNIYPPGTEYVSSYIESRGDLFPAHLFVGFQAFVKKHLVRPLTIDDIDEAGTRHPPARDPVQPEGRLGAVNHHGGRLPVQTQVVPDGTVLPKRVCWCGQWKSTWNIHGRQVLSKPPSHRKSRASRPDQHARADAMGAWRIRGARAAISRELIDNKGT